mgnify:CR=1 FL=1
MRNIPCLALAVALSTGCRVDGAAYEPIALEIVVESDAGVYLEGVPVRIDGRVVGRTPRAGALRTTLSPRVSRVVRVGHECPHGHAQPSSQKLLRLKAYRAGETPESIEVRLRCRPTTRVGAFLVHAIGGPGLPVLVNGQEVVRTSEHGIAHFSTSGPAGAEFHVQIDASGSPNLLPRQTSHVFILPDSHELFVVDQAFERRTGGGRARLRRPRILKIE